MPIYVPWVLLGLVASAATAYFITKKDPPKRLPGGAGGAVSDPSALPLLAQQVAETLQLGPSRYDRSLVAYFQTNVGINPTGLYDAETRSALMLYGVPSEHLPPTYAKSAPGASPDFIPGVGPQSSRPGAGGPSDSMVAAGVVAAGGGALAALLKSASSFFDDDKPDPRPRPPVGPPAPSSGPPAPNEQDGRGPAPTWTGQGNQYSNEAWDNYLDGYQGFSQEELQRQYEEAQNTMGDLYGDGGYFEGADSSWWGQQDAGYEHVDFSSDEWAGLSQEDIDAYNAQSQEWGGY